MTDTQFTICERCHQRLEYRGDEPPATHDDCPNKWTQGVFR